MKITITDAFAIVAVVAFGIFVHAPDPQVALAIIMPRGGEILVFGDPLDIRWEPRAYGGPISLALVNPEGNQLYRTLLEGTANDGSERWYVDVSPGEYALSIGGERSRSFTVKEGITTRLPNEAQNTPANRGLTLYFPRGGETLHSGTVETIRWYGGDPSWNISLRLLSSSDFSLKQVIGENITHANWYAWSVPYVISDSAYYLELACTNCSNGSDTKVLTRYPITIKNP